MLSYHLTGSLSALFTILSLWGLTLQLRRIYRRRRQKTRELSTEKPTDILSLNRFSASFFAFYSTLLYGSCLQKFNYYVVVPRVVAVFLLLAIMNEIRRDRSDMKVKIIVGLAALCILIAIALVLSDIRVQSTSLNISSLLVVISTLLLFQGSIHQIARIRESGKTGGLSRGMHLLFFLKDFFSMVFGGVIGVQFGWPLIMLHTTSGIMQVVTLWHFRWVRVSKVAAEKRVIL